jgi:hypothetical protein
MSMPLFLCSFQVFDVLSRTAFRVAINCSRSPTIMTPASTWRTSRGGISPRLGPGVVPDSACSGRLRSAFSVFDLYHTSSPYSRIRRTHPAKVQPSHSRPRHPFEILSFSRFVRVPVALSAFFASMCDLP